MKSFFLIPSDKLRTIYFLLIVLFFIFSIKWFLLLTLLFSFYLILFRREIYEDARLRSVDSSIFLTPLSGKVFVDENILVINTPFWKNFGICMPFSGSVVGYEEEVRSIFTLGPFKLNRSVISIKLQSENLGTVNITIKGRVNLFHRAQVWLRSGDYGLIGATIGYLPFGGEVEIVLPANLNVLVKNKDELLKMRTILVSTGI